MNKKIPLGSIIAVLLLLLMPIIPATHLNAIENEIQQESEELTFTDFIDIELPDKFPLLFVLVVTLGLFKAYRAEILFGISTELGYYPRDWRIVHPLIFIKGVILILRANLWMGGWDLIADTLEWDWDLI